jgi:hypothetical protein
MFLNWRISQADLRFSISNRRGLNFTIFIVSILLIWQSIYPLLLQSAFGQFTEDTLTVDLSATGEARITEELTPSTTAARVTVSSISPKVSNILAVDESNIILKSVLTNDEIRIDTLGAAHVTLTYNAEILNRTSDIWNVQYTSAINSKVVLPPGSELLFVNNIPNDIVENTIIMPAGEVSLSYKTRGVTADTFIVTWNGTDYRVGILSVSKIRSLNFEQRSKSVVLGLDSRETILVIMPKALLGGPYDVRAGNGDQIVQFNEYYQNASHAWIRLEPSNTNSIRIIGTTVIPEFQFPPLAVGGITVSLVILLFYVFSKKWTSFNKSWGREA